jgi:hypothetical protein
MNLGLPLAYRKGTLRSGSVRCRYRRGGLQRGHRQLVEADLLGFRGGGVERDGTGDERKAQKALPVAGPGRGTPKLRTVRTQDGRGLSVPTLAAPLIVFFWFRPEWSRVRGPGPDRAARVDVLSSGWVLRMAWASISYPNQWTASDGRTKSRRPELKNRPTAELSEKETRKAAAAFEREQQRRETERRKEEAAR